MVLRIQNKNRTWSFHYLEKVVAKRFKIKRSHFLSWMSAEKAASLLKIKPDQVLDYCAESHNLHAVLYNDVLYVNPKSLINHMAKAARRYIKRILDNPNRIKQPKSSKKFLNYLG